MLIKKLISGLIFILISSAGTTSGGVIAESYEQNEYSTPGMLSIKLDPVDNPVFTGTADITGIFTLANADPFDIKIEVTDCSGGLASTYTATVDSYSQRFSATIDLHSPIDNEYIHDDLECKPSTPCEHTITAIITQGELSTDDATWISSVKALEAYGIDNFGDFICEQGNSTGWIEGSFLLSVPNAHVSEIKVKTYVGGGKTIWLDVRDIDESRGFWHLDFDITPNSPLGDFEVEITDTFGNRDVCACVTKGCKVKKSSPVQTDSNDDKNKKSNKTSEPRKREPKKTDGANDR